MRYWQLDGGKLTWIQHTSTVKIFISTRKFMILVFFGYFSDDTADYGAVRRIYAPRVSL